jgi:TPP-dependent pyruvate/acetoin dehydrogenase alpha subunit
LAELSAQNSAGQANNPAQTQLLLSQIFGQQATKAGRHLSDMIRGNASNSVTGGASIGSGINPADVWAWIQQNLAKGDTSGADGMS